MPRGTTAFDPSRLRATRHQRGLSLHEVAEQTGLTTWHIAKLESGRHLPSVTMLQPLAHVLNVDVKDLLIDSGSFAYLRARAGKTQAAVAADLGISPAAIGRLEGGLRAHVSDRMAEQLAASLRCSSAAVLAAHRLARRTA